jgi:hypothetical protein
MKPGEAAHFMLRVRRDGPLVCARIWLDDAEPDAPDNKLDRGRLSVYPRAVIAGEEVDPDILQRDRLMSPTDWHPAYAPGHWKYAQTISAAEYRFQAARREWAVKHRPDDPTTKAREPIKPAQLPLPSFERENA